MENIPTNPIPNRNGVRVNTLNLGSKQPSGIATRLRTAGIDWVIDLAQCLKSNNYRRINVWLRLLPYLVVTNSTRRAKHSKGKASKAALEALDELEGR